MKHSPSQSPETVISIRIGVKVSCTFNFLFIDLTSVLIEYYREYSTYYPTTKANALVERPPVTRSVGGPKLAGQPIDWQASESCRLAVIGDLFMLAVVSVITTKPVSVSVSSFVVQRLCATLQFALNRQIQGCCPMYREASNVTVCWMANF